MSHVDEIRGALDRVEALPDSALGVLQIVSDPSTSADEILAALRGQPAMTTSILALSNSGSHDLPCRITDVSQAVAYLGTGALVRMVVTLSTLPYFLSAGGGARRGGETWAHSVACGTAAQIIAERTGSVDPGCAFAAGMLHDLGRLPVAAWSDDHHQALDEATLGCRDGYPQAERQVLGIDHAAAGAALAERWRLPLNLRQAIRHHHDPGLITAGDDLACVVHVADVLVMQLGIGLGPEGLSYRVCQDAIGRLHLAPAELDRIRLSVFDALARSADLLQLVHRPADATTTTAAFGKEGRDA